MLLQALSFRSGGAGAAEPFAVQAGRLTVRDEMVFRDDPMNILRLFREAARTDARIHPAAMRLITQSLDLIDDGFRADPEANALFLELLCDRRHAEWVLRLMNETEVLGRFMPEFGRIVAMMQFNMYHHYTVDEHIIRTIGVLNEIERLEASEEHPVATEILKSELNRRVLYVALLLHDIGKGEPRDHSEVGAGIAQRFCPRLGLSGAEMRDGDLAGAPPPADVRRRPEARHLRPAHRPRFRQAGAESAAPAHAAGADRLRHPRRRPGGLEQLEGAAPAQPLLGHPRRADRRQRAEPHAPDRRRPWRSRRRAGRLARGGPPGRARPPLRALLAGPRHGDAVIFAEIARDAAGSPMATRFLPDESRDATKACLYMADHPGLFSRMAGAFALAGADVVDARTYTTTDGMASVGVLDPGRRGPPSRPSA